MKRSFAEADFADLDKQTREQGELLKRVKEKDRIMGELVGLLAQAIPDLTPEDVGGEDRILEAKRFFRFVAAEKTVTTNTKRMRRAAVILTPWDAARETVTVILVHPNSNKISKEKVIQFLSQNDGYHMASARLLLSYEDPKLFWKIWRARKELVAQDGNLGKKDAHVVSGLA